MNYQETVKYLYAKLPAFQKYGKRALKPSFENIEKLCAHLGNPQNKFKSVHVAGTNGKGSSSHMIASVFQEGGYKTGLYTSPHLKDFRERFRINGELVNEAYIIDFVKKHKAFIEDLEPSFFEVTVAMAFLLFAEENVDIAIIEVGLGGRLDSTNIITPLLSLITNIGLDHMDVLGDSLEKIAHEKGGIIKDYVPVVISERQKETTPIFNDLAKRKNSTIYFAEDLFKNKSENTTTNCIVNCINEKDGWEIELDLKGPYQRKNLLGVLTTLEILGKHFDFAMEKNIVSKGLANVIKNTGLKGRWQKLGTNPTIICDTGHNEHSFRVLFDSIKSYKPSECHFVLGFAKDKELNKTLGLLPVGSNYYFANFDSIRCKEAKDLESVANLLNISFTEAFLDVNEALAAAKNKAKKGDFIYVGGSTYLVAEIKGL